MKTRRTLPLLYLALLCLPGFAYAQSTAFTYTGRLNNNGSPASGAHDLRFTIYDAVDAGNAIAGPLDFSPVDVANGLFTVRLDFGAGVFTGPARWLKIEVRPVGAVNFTPLSPRQELTSSPYAIRAQTAANVANGAVTANQLNTAGLAPAPGQFLSYNGGSLLWTDPGLAAGNIWSVLNNNAYFTLGKVGVGTTVPQTPLEVNGVLRSTRNNNAAQYLQLDGGDPASIRMTAQSIVSAEKSLLIQNLSGEATPGVNNSIQFALGTTAAPSIKMSLTKDGNLILPLGGSGGAIQLGTPNAETGMSIVGANRADIRFDGSTLKLLAGAGTGIPSAANGITINTAGNVGIGTTTPIAKLHAETSVAGRAAVYGVANSTSGVGVYGSATEVSSVGVWGHNPNGLAVYADGNAAQARDKGGFVKAMVQIHYDGAGSSAIPFFVRCYNGVTGATSGQCGFSYDHYVADPFGYLHTTIDFGFTVDDRFISLTAIGGQTPQAVSVFGFPNAHTIDVRNDGDFYLIVY